MTIRGRARSICVLLAALALTTSAYAAPTSAPRARSRATPAPATSRPRDSPDIETSNVDMNDVEAFLTQARDEFIATRASRGSSHGRSTTTMAAPLVLPQVTSPGRVEESWSRLLLLDLP